MGKKIKISKQNQKGTKEKFWIVVALVSMTVYIIWRLFFTIPDHNVYGWLATVCGIFLAVSETISMLEGTEHFARLGKKSAPDMPIVPQEWYPDVDILIATHNEETELLYKTVNGCRHMDYPDKKKVHIYICDDGNRPEMAELAKKMKVGYFGLADNKEAKAGNLNHALSKTSSPWIVTFDSDMIPTHDFLMETVPYIFLPRMKKMDDGTWAERTEEEMDEKYKIGFIQTPQSFYNPDMFQYNFFSETRIPNEQDFFFREINVGRNNANAPIYAGSNTLISRDALDAVGGIATGTITEDFETGIKIQAKGYSCYAVDKTLAHGLAPTDIDNLIKQRVRWGRGCITSLRRTNLLFNPHIKLNAKISYLACWMYWWTFFRRFIYIISPILFILFGIPVVICSLKELIFIWLPSYVLYNQALKVTSGKIRNKRWSNTVDTVIFPYMIIPVLLETLFIRQKKFNVTSKTRDTARHSDMMLAIPQTILLVFDVVALVIAARSAFQSGNFGAAVLIYWLALNAQHLVMALFFMSGRRNLRTTDRFYVRVPVEISYQGKQFYGVTTDLSETGLAVLCDKSIYMPHGEEQMTLRLKTERYESELGAHCVHVQKQGDKWKYGIQITDVDDQNKDSYFQILYDRDHSLAKTMSPSVSIIDDIFLNVQKRSAHAENSKRQLPRIELNRMMDTVDGKQVYVQNCNYEYLLVKEETTLPEVLEIRIPGSDSLMKCVKMGNKAGLYRLDNWKELLFSDAFDLLFAQVEEKRDKVS
ncbi:glycosyltransferase family 2 protein [Clostridium transplantifaecale]|uniref:glycosyltransferase family 2 protein n=1 Tax=Clostridium transplantifaecale TaxID=2479838 RepID=UPI001FAB04CB|nr:glycosyltransferase family 2 protein [Clostridium transplantifaecale]